jgi:hypothetical protein
MTGIERIAVERQRQRDVEGWDAEHDRGHGEELALAGACYAAPHYAPEVWPWDPQWWKPTPENRIRELEKAGALIAAAIDSLQADR